MKLLLLLIFFPLAAFSQTVHVEEDEVKYKGEEKLQGVSAREVSNRAEKALAEFDSKRFEFIKKDFTADGINLLGSIRLTTPYPIIRKMFFNMKINPAENGYTYTVDKVYLFDQRRGGKERIIPSKEMVDDLEDAGKQAAELEKMLNEFDMRLQQLLAHLRRM